MENSNIQPIIGLAIAALVSVVIAGAVTYFVGPTFAERWAPVEQINAGIKGNRHKPMSKPNSYWYNGPYRLYGRSRIVCNCETSFRDFP